MEKTSTAGRPTGDDQSLEMRRIVDLLDRAGGGDAWHGPSLDATLDGVTAGQAAARPLAHAHTIIELVLHVAVWERVVARRLRGDAVEPTPAQDWPRAEAPTAEEWRDAIADLRRSRAELRAALLAFDEGRLGQTVQGRNYSFYVMAHGVVQHDLYHAGQIAILKKAHA